MPTVEERISSLEAKVDAIADLRHAIGELRTDMNRQFGEVRADMNRQFDELRTDMNRRFGDVDRRFEQMDRRIEILDQRMERHFMWMVGIQFTVLLAVIVALIQMSPR
jgi:chromosome segregation ATPase